MGLFSRLFGSKDRSPSRTSRPAAKRPAPEPRLPRGWEAPRGDEALILYKFDSCPFCQRVMRQIGPLELSADIELRDTQQDPKAHTLLRERTGRTQVPCLFIDGRPMFESSDIADYLQLYAKAKAAQADPA